MRIDDMEQEPQRNELAAEAERLRLFMDEPVRDTPTKREAWAAQMRALAQRITQMRTRRRK